MNALELAAELERVRRAAREIYSATEVDAAIRRMAARATADLEDKNPVVIAIMQGGVFTAVHLSEQFEFVHEFDYVHVASYGKELTGGSLEWIVRPRASCRNRAVLLVDDVLDRGVTLSAVQTELKKMHVAELRTAVLVYKELGAMPRPDVDYVGLRAGSEYLFGCGMDYKGYWRNLRSVFAVASSSVAAGSGRDLGGA